MLNPFKIISKFISSDNQKNLDKLRVIVKKVNELEIEIAKLEDSEFPKRTLLLKNRLNRRTINDGSQLFFQKLFPHF